LVKKKTDNWNLSNCLLKTARESTLEAKVLLAQGIDPSAVKKEAKALNIEQACQ
jgi:hypothetical protein